MRRWIIFAVVVVLIAGAIGFLSTRPKPPTSVKVSKVGAKDVPLTVSGSGDIKADRVLPVVSKVADDVNEVLVSEGDRVEQDDDVVDYDDYSDAEAPIDGTVVRVNVVPGQQVAPGQTLMQIADFDPTHFMAKIDEAEIAKVKAGQKAQIVLDAYPGRKIPARVIEIGLVSVPTEGGGIAYPVKLVVGRHSGVRLRLGMSGDADVTVAVHKKAVVVPTQAVTSKNKKDVVFLIEGRKVRLRVVTVGTIGEGYYEITRGLAAGDEIAVTNIDELEDKSPVKRAAK